MRLDQAQRGGAPQVALARQAAGAEEEAALGGGGVGRVAAVAGVVRGVGAELGTQRVGSLGAGLKGGTREREQGEGERAI